MFEFRILTKEDMYQQQELMQYAFNPRENNYNNISIEEYDKYFKPVTFFGLFDGEVLASTLIIISFQQMIRGVSLPMAGIAGVATKPEYRRKGLVRKLFEETYIYCKENNYPISTLYPFKVSYYEQFGYAWVENLTMITSWIDAIKKQNITGYRVEEEKNYEKALERMRPIYKKYLLTTNGLIDRDTTTNSFNKRLDKGFFFFSVDKQGNDTGYLVTWFVEDETIGIREIIALDIQTRKNLWNFISLHEGHRNLFKIPDYLPHSIQTYPYLKEPRVKKVEIIPNAMLRIVDIQKTLSNLQYANISESITFTLIDPDCEWNNKTWYLSVDNGKGAISENSKENVELKLDIKGLAQLIAGFRNTTELAEQQWIKGNLNAYMKLDRIFPKDFFIVRDFF